MKKIITLLFLPLAAMLCLTGCFDNNDNVDYRSINVVEVSDPMSEGSAEEAIVVEMFTTLQLTPTIAQTIAKDESNLEYKWIMHENRSTLDYSQWIDLGTERNLNMEITAATGPHKILYTVTDRNTGVEAYLQYDIRVVGTLTEGWVILEETSQGGDMSMIKPTGELVREIYSKPNGGHLPTPCYQMQITDNYGTKSFFVLTDGEGAECSWIDFLKISDMPAWFVPGMAPDVINPQAMHVNSSASWRGLINDGRFHVRVSGGFPGTPGFGPSLPAPMDNDGSWREYELAPFILTGPMSYSSQSIMYDDLQKRFMYAFGTMGQTIENYPYDAQNDAWNPADVGMTMLHMDFTRTANQINAVMQDGGGKLWLLGCDATAVSTPANNFAETIVELPSQVNGFTMAMSSKRVDFIYFAVGNSIGHFDVPGESYTVDYTFTGNEKPVYMTSEVKDGVETLYIATWDGTAGKLYIFETTATGTLPEDHDLYQGFGKIVHMVYKQ